MGKLIFVWCDQCDAAWLMEAKPGYEGDWNLRLRVACMFATNRVKAVHYYNEHLKKPGHRRS